MLIRGQCHCGNIAFTLTWEPDPTEIPARACDCSFCQKHGGVWTAYADGQLKVTVQRPSHMSRYSFGTRTAEFLTCAQCGVVPVVTSLIDGRLFAVVSVNAIDNVDPSLFRHAAVSFEGEDAVSRLARRKRHWIGQVDIVEGSG
jgi:hypothetical protein